MNRTKLADRTLPGYTREEEIFNMVTHIVGGGFGVIVTALCVTVAALHRSPYALVGGVVYGLMMIFLYTMSSIYHGLTKERPKKVMQVIDHCSIYALILGSYVPILCSRFRLVYPRLTLVMLGVLAACIGVGVTFTAIDFKKYRLISYGTYFVMGWCIIFAVKPVIVALGWPFFWWLLGGGVAYTSGMAFYAKGGKVKYAHSIFHLFILLGTVLQFAGIFTYCIWPL